LKTEQVVLAVMPAWIRTSNPLKLMMMSSTCQLALLLTLIIN